MKEKDKIRYIKYRTALVDKEGKFYSLITSDKFALSGDADFETRTRINTHAMNNLKKKLDKIKSKGLSQYGKIICSGAIE